MQSQPTPVKNENVHIAYLCNFNYIKFVNIINNYFNEYEINDNQSCDNEFENGDLNNRLAKDIAHELFNFKGNWDDLCDAHMNLNLLCNNIAYIFMTQFSYNRNYITINEYYEKMNMIISRWS
jgi:hypothetical protein